MTKGLTSADVAKLLADRSAASRADTAEKIADAFEHGGLSGREREIAEEIFRVLARDVENRVRQALSENLRDSRLLPHDIALSLAKDVKSVALPILEYSEVLTDEDLIEIVHGRDSDKQVAIARRRKVSAPVASALVDSENPSAVAELVGNEGAELTEPTLQKALDRYAGHEGVKQRMAFRFALPPTVLERLVHLVTERLRGHLMAQQELPSDAVSDLIQFSRERATLGIVWGSGLADLERFVRQLHSNDRLTPTLLLRAICMGDRLFFETGVAVRAGVPMRNAVALIYDEGRRGFRALYDKAGLPGDLFNAFATATSVARETELNGLDDGDRERYRQRVIERILTQFENLGADNIEYLLAKLGRRHAESIAAAG